MFCSCLTAARYFRMRAPLFSCKIPGLHGGGELLLAWITCMHQDIQGACKLQQFSSSHLVSWQKLHFLFQPLLALGDLLHLHFFLHICNEHCELSAVLSNQKRVYLLSCRADDCSYAWRKMGKQQAGNIAHRWYISDAFVGQVMKLLENAAVADCLSYVAFA